MLSYAGGYIWLILTDAKGDYLARLKTGEESPVVESAMLDVTVTFANLDEIKAMAFDGTCLWVSSNKVGVGDGLLKVNPSLLLYTSVGRMMPVGQ